jgi:hypothetical protein
MTNHSDPLLKSTAGTPSGSGHAEPAAPVTGRGAPKVVAEGVRTALGPDPDTDTVTVSGVCQHVTTAQEGRAAA